MPEHPPTQDSWDHFPLVDALLVQRSRRFAKGMRLNL